MSPDETTRRRLASFLEEDLGRGDITSDSVVAPGALAVGSVRAREAGVAAGVHEATLLAEIAGLRAEPRVGDGDAFAEGAGLLRLHGRARAILGVERTLLNLLSHMSGVATRTRRAVDALAGTGARIAATRKTLPGLRAFEKRAVVLGGGDPHRFDLGDAVLIKDNHLALAGGVVEAVRRAREKASFTASIEVEVESIDDALAAAEAGADVLMLDNMDPERVRETVAALQAAGLRGRVTLEASGGIRPEAARPWAEAGVDIISCGALTASSPTLDLTLTLTPVNEPEAPEDAVPEDTESS